MKIFLIGLFSGIIFTVLFWAGFTYLPHFTMTEQTAVDTPSTFTPIPFLGSTREYIDTAHIFSFRYPSEWLLSHPEEGGKDSGDFLDGATPFVVEESFYEKQEKDGWKSYSRDVGLRVDRNKDIFENITVRRIDTCVSPTVDRFHTQKNLLVNGTPALYDRLEFVGPSDVESYLDHLYIFEKFVNGTSFCIELSFREYWRSTWTPETDQEYSDLLPGFEYIVSTFTFL